MKIKRFSKAMACILSACMILSSFTVAASAASDYQSETHDVFKHTESTLAPGIEQSINYAYAKDGKQMVYYVATADVNRDDVVVQTSYLKQHENGVMGMEKLTNQIAYANAKYSNPEDDKFISEYYNVVAGVNASFYNMTTGQPMGITYIDGVSFGTSSYDNFFAILNDGKTAVIDYAKNLGNYVDSDGNSTIWQAAAGSQWLVRDGADVTASATGSYNTDRHSRTCVGVTAEGKVVMMALDGRQEPFSCGGSMHELAQIMLEQGCVAAINLDGGGSTTYAARQAGTDSVQVINRPSDGSERSISSGLIIASTATPSDVFDTAVLTADSDYVTPNSTVNVSAVGVSPAGTSAEIPADVTWQLADSSLGTVAGGVFTSNGTTGDAVVQMVYEGKVVGETTIHVVIPEISFINSEMTVPYNKTFSLSVIGTTNGGLNEVMLKDSDYFFELGNADMGTITGNSYTTCAESTGLTGGTITVKCVYDETKCDTATLTFGKASVIVEDFESGDISGWAGASAYAPSKGPFGRLENGYVELVNSDSGKVRNGNYAIALTADFTETSSSGYKAVKYTFPTIDLTGATTFGMWMYLPVVDVSYLEFDIGGYEYYIKDDNRVTEDGWYYISAKASSVGSSVSKFTIFMTDPDETYFNSFDKFTIFVDDLTVDYSNATDDRDIPKFNSVNAVIGLDNEVAMNGQTLSQDTITVKATAAEDLTGNYTGLDVSTARVYLDGVKLSSEVYSCDKNGMITVPDLTLSNGSHVFRFEIDDFAGNTGFITRKVVINNNDSNVSVVRRSNTALPLAGSVEYFDVIAKNVENVQSVHLTIDLDTLSEWQLKGADTLFGFEIAYTVDSFSNEATIKLNRTGNVEVTGEQTIASLPVRVWANNAYLMDKYINGNRVTDNPGLVDQGWCLTPAAIWNSDGAHLVRIEFNVNSSVVKYTDDITDTFAGTEYNIITENNRYRSSAYYDAEGNLVSCDATTVKQGKNSSHIHTAEAIADKAATCTEAGYTGRTFCEVCNSVVDWGTTIPATGHTYETIDGVLKCKDCGELFNGEYTDGKTYFDGVVANGLIDGKYYVDGVIANNYICIDGVYYVVENGVKGSVYTGLVQKDGKWCYSKLGNLTGGWISIDNDWYYFDSNSFEAVSTLNNGKVTFSFEENGKLSSGEWYNDGKGTKYYYGPGFYHATNSTRVNWQKINGNTYGFDVNGYRYEGIVGIVEYVYSNAKLYEFTNDGILIGPYDVTGITGLVDTSRGESYYFVNGELNHAGVVKIDGAYYYIDSSCKAVKNVTRSVIAAWANGLVPEGTYTFDADGKMVNPPAETEIKDGLNNIGGKLYYYLNGEPYHAGLVMIDGDYYYINTQCVAVTNTTRFVAAAWANGLLPEGNYSFGADGKMILPQ